MDHTLEDITKIKKAINDDQTYQNLASFNLAYKLALHHGCLGKIDGNFRRKATWCLLSREFYTFTIREVLRYDEKLKKVYHCDDLTDISLTTAEEIENKRRTYWLEIMEENFCLSRKLTMLRNRGNKLA